MPIQFLLSIRISKFFVIGGFAFWPIVVGLLATQTVWAGTIINGTVQDQATSLNIVGAKVTIFLRGTSLGEAATNRNGQFSMQIDADLEGQGQSTLTIFVEHQEFEARSANATVTNGRPDKSNYKISLILRSMSGCLLKGRGVVVGNFGSDALASAITDALIYNLMPHVQTAPSLKDLGPPILACNAANPKSKLHYAGYSKALAADVFLGGKVKLKEGETTSDVKIFVGDQYGLFYPPRKVENTDVNLEDAEAAQLNPQTHASILTAIAKGLELEGQYEKCVDLLGIAEKLGGKITPESQDLRNACQAKLPNVGLLRDHTP